MTRNHNQPAWDAFEQLACHYLIDERHDYEGQPEEDREGHIYDVWMQLERWVSKDREDAQHGYNGWANYETSLLVLWHDNDEGSYRDWRDATHECYRLAGNNPDVRDRHCTVHESAQISLANRLKEAITSQQSAGVVGFAADLLGAALERVDWFELAGYLLQMHVDEGCEAPTETDDASPSGVHKFEPGQVVATPGAVDAVSRAEMLTAIRRHLSGDWGEVSASDRAENELSLREGYRILSVYRTADGDKFWIITEADRSATTVLLPEEY